MKIQLILGKITCAECNLCTKSWCWNILALVLQYRHLENSLSLTRYQKDVHLTTITCAKLVSVKLDVYVLIFQYLHMESKADMTKQKTDWWNEVIFWSNTFKRHFYYQGRPICQNLFLEVTFWKRREKMDSENGLPSFDKHTKFIWGKIYGHI